MEDILDLDVVDNEFSSEDFAQCARDDIKGGVTDCNSDLAKAKQALLVKVEAYGEDLDNECTKENQNNGGKERISVKMRLGVPGKVEAYEGNLDKNGIKDDQKNSEKGRLPVKMRLGELGKDVEVMEWDETEEKEGQQDEKPSLQYNKRSNRSNQHRKYKSSYHDGEDIASEPTMNKLFKRLTVKWHHRPEKIGKEIAERLEERKFSLIIDVVKTIGGGKALELFQETRDIQLNGGMATADGKRRRTSGGIFLTLLKNKFATEEEVKKIFREDAKYNVEALKRKRASQRKKYREKQKAAEENKMKTDEETKIDEKPELHDNGIT